jgi:DNA-binding transcriptional LysR family regulator
LRQQAAEKLAEATSEALWDVCSTMSARKGLWGINCKTVFQQPAKNPLDFVPPPRRGFQLNYRLAKPQPACQSSFHPTNPMRRIDFITLKLFSTIADELNLTKAAEREHLALAAVSKRITDLEEESGVQLLYRLAKGVALTPGGHALLHHARNILSSLERLDADLSEYSRGVRGHVRIYANTSSIIQFLPEDLSSFLTQHSAIKIDMQEKMSAEIIRAVREGLTDIGVYNAHVPAEGLEVFPYRQDRLILIAPTGHPLAGRSAVTLQDAAEYDFVALRQDSSLHWLVCQSAQKLGIVLRVRIQVHSFDAICRMIETGLGVGILPDKAAQSHIRSMRIVGIPIDGSWAQRKINLCVRDYNALSVISKQLVDHLSSQGASSGGNRFGEKSQLR